jgi:hypothetical protein
MSKTARDAEHISADDLRAKMQSFQDGITGKIESKRNSLLATGGGALVVLLFVFFVLGKRSGKKKTTLVEIRRL